MADNFKRTFSLAAYLLAVAVVLLALSELTARILNLAPPLGNEFANMVADPYLPFKPRPGSTISGRSKFDEFDYHVEINSVGLRDFERPYKKPEGTFRILGLGDSTTYGGAALLEDTYLRRVERALNARAGAHPTVEIIKAGVPRFFPTTERMMLEHYGIRYEPDLIMVGFGKNDVIDTLYGLDATRTEESGTIVSKEFDAIGRPGMFLYRNSHAARILLKRYILFSTHQPDWDEVYKANGIYERQWLEVENEFRKMVDIGHSIGAKLVIIYIPDFTVFDRGAERRYPPRRLRAWADRNDAMFVDISPAMLNAADTSEEPLFFARDRHPTPAGYKIIADTVYEALIAKNLVP